MPRILSLFSCCKSCFGEKPNNKNNEDPLILTPMANASSDKASTSASYSTFSEPPLKTTFALPPKPKARTSQEKRNDPLRRSQPISFDGKGFYMSRHGSIASQTPSFRLNK